MKVPAWVWIGAGALALWYVARKASAANIDRMAAEAAAAKPSALEPGQLMAPDIQALVSLPQLNVATSGPAADQPLIDFNLVGGA